MDAKAYNVHMALYTASEARRLFFRLLNAVQRGERVEFERDGVRFALSLAEAQETPPTVAVLAAVDEAVLAGDWTWASDDAGELIFVAQRDDPS